MKDARGFRTIPASRTMHEAHFRRFFGDLPEAERKRIEKILLAPIVQEVLEAHADNYSY